MIISEKNGENYPINHMSQLYHMTRDDHRNANLWRIFHLNNSRLFLDIMHSYFNRSDRAFYQSKLLVDWSLDKRMFRGFLQDLTTLPSN